MYHFLACLTLTTIFLTLRIFTITLLVSAANLWCSKGGESAVEFGETFGPYTKEAGYGVSQGDL